MPPELLFSKIRRIRNRLNRMRTTVRNPVIGGKTNTKVKQEIDLRRKRNTH
jgi:hypothetical protein